MAIPEQSNGGFPQEVVDNANDMRDTVRTVAKFFAKYPVPSIDLLKIGFFF